MGGSGVFYLPNANPLNFQGNPTASVSTCTEVIAASIQFSGTPNFDNSGCSNNIKLKSPACSIGAMMKKLDQRGVAAFEFCLVAVPLFISMFAIFDLGRYAITMHSLHALANAGAREWMMCYRHSVLQSQPDTGCFGDALPNSCRARRLPRSFIMAGVDAYTERGSGGLRYYCYGLTTRFHHADANMGHSTERAERVHPNSALAHS